MRLKRLKTALLRPERLIVALGVAALSLFLMSAAWLAATKQVRKKVEHAIAKVSKKLGVPVEVGRWRLGLGAVQFEDIVVGPEANVVVSRVSVDVGLNPFDDNFLELESVTVHRVRVKSPFDHVQGGVDRLRAAALGDAAPSLSSPKSIEKMFQALPVRRLLVKSGTVVLIGADQKPLVSLRGAQLLIDKRQSKVLFHVASLKTKDGLGDDHLQGRFELMPKGHDYRFFVRRKVKPAAKTNAWAISGLLRKDLASADLEVFMARPPAFLAEPLKPWLGQKPVMRLSGDVKVKRQDAKWTFDARLQNLGTRLEVPLVSSAPVGPVLFDVVAKGFADTGEGLLALESASIQIPPRKSVKRDDAHPVRVRIEGAARVVPPVVPEGAPGFDVRGQAKLESTLCQDLLDASPPGLLPALVDFKLEGSAAATLNLAFDSTRPETVTASLSDAKWGCKVQSAPYTYTAEHLAGPFTLQRETSKDGEPLEISVSPLSPGFTPFEQVAKNVSLAFTASEDAGFWTHKGIDTFALENALKKNFTEGRVAVGGSTITMQTVKNLFLTHERTISRKMQELFLSWHLENILEKQRIFEIYVNIVEFGPNLYGITQAAEHYFGKHPFDLTLLESAYLAQLLPSPKTRYQYFCDGKLSQNFEGMVYGLLRRMVSLNKIPHERFVQAMGSPLQFNEQARRTAYACDPGKKPGRSRASASEAGAASEEL